MTTQRRAQHATNPLLQLREYGQAVWLDFLSRPFIADGDLQQLVEKDGLAGVTSNPSIFEKAIAQSRAYDSSLKTAEAEGDREIMALYEELAIEDIKRAAGVLLPVYQKTDGQDGYVSLEVSPYLAMDTEATIAEARRLWTAVGCGNIMIKVPATKPGLPAIRELIGEGINVNITLLFSQKTYREVVEAYLAGLERLAARGEDPSKVASVASFFVSRIDTAVDKLIDERLEAKTADQSTDVAGLRGKIAIANAKLAYQMYKRLFAGARWDNLKTKGARVQRLLWASTGVKNPAYRDVLYVEELIAADTVNTLPPSTLDAFRDHGRVGATLERNIDQAEQQMAALGRLGISIDQVTDKLVIDGVGLFAEAFDQLLGAVAHKRVDNLGTRLDGQTYTLPETLEKSVEKEVDAWRRAGNVRRLWTRDASLWTGLDESQWLGWLDIGAEQQKRIGDLRTLTDDIRRPEFTHVVLLGMGGSSLGPEVIAETFGPQPERPKLLVLDSTDPAQIRSIEATIDPQRTLFLVSSKSGTTLEPNILKQYFFERVRAALGADRAGSRFIAVTDPGSKLQQMAERDRFRSVAFGKPSIGGRYSVLSDFGIVPAALMGIDIGRLLKSAELMMRSCGPSVPPSENPGVMLGVILAQLAKAGRDKVTIIASPGIADFGAWLEQLLAESTGKLGKGLIPVDAELVGPPDVYGKDRLFAYIRLTSGPDASQDEAISTLERAGHPVVRIVVADRYQIGQEFFRWELATAVAGSVLGINPFDQPDVEASKIKTRELTTAYESHGTLPEESPILRDQSIEVFTDKTNAEALGVSGDTLATCLKKHLGRLGEGDYCALLAYVERSAEHMAALQEIRLLVRNRKRVASCLGFGPRFLHSTGQAYKGGPNSGVFLQITCQDANDLKVPGHKYTFGIVKAAEARGDFEVLAERERRVLRVHLGADVGAGLAMLKVAVQEALR
jgi:transaldolase / glucose-6-phosphate isomerase